MGHSLQGEKTCSQTTSTIRSYFSEPWPGSLGSFLQPQMLWKHGGNRWNRRNAMPRFENTSSSLALEASHSTVMKILCSFYPSILQRSAGTWFREIKWFLAPSAIFHFAPPSITVMKYHHHPVEVTSGKEHAVSNRSAGDPVFLRFQCRDRWRFHRPKADFLKKQVDSLQATTAPGEVRLGVSMIVSSINMYIMYTHYIHIYIYTNRCIDSTLWSRLSDFMKSHIHVFWWSICRCTLAG